MSVLPVNLNALPTLPRMEATQKSREQEERQRKINDLSLEIFYEEQEQEILEGNWNNRWAYLILGVFFIDFAFYIFKVRYDISKLTNP